MLFKTCRKEKNQTCKVERDELVRENDSRGGPALGKGGVDAKDGGQDCIRVWKWST